MGDKGKTPRGPGEGRPRRPPPLHQGTLEEALARLGLRDITVKPMFGGRCYYAEGKPFSLLLGSAFALKLPAVQLRAACERGDGRLFRPGDGDFVMREYLELSDHALTDEGRGDAYLQASYRFVAGQGAPRAELSASDLREGRERLYKRDQKSGPGNRNAR